MIEHAGISVADFAAAKKFYEKALEPLGIKPLMGEDGHYFGFGVGRPIFWISVPREGASPAKGAHYAFAANSKEEVEAFHKAALEAGGKDNGGPGYREIYSPDYYAAFVYDPDGNNVEVVFHDMEKK